MKVINKIIVTVGIASALSGCAFLFYQYVNKSWLNNPENAIPNEYPRWGGFIKLHDDGLKKQIQLVKKLCDKTDKTEEEMKIYTIWEASCGRFSQWSKGEGNYEPIYKELEILANSKGINLVLTTFNGTYLGYGPPSESFDINHRETRETNWFGKYGGDYFAEVIRMIIENK